MYPSFVNVDDSRETVNDEENAKKKFTISYNKYYANKKCKSFICQLFLGYNLEHSCSGSRWYAVLLVNNFFLTIVSSVKHLRVCYFNKTCILKLNYSCILNGEIIPVVLGCCSPVILLSSIVNI